MRRSARLAPALLLAVTACAEPRFAFRGYTDLSSCRQVIDTELANGAEFATAYDSTDPEAPGHVTELTGSLFDLPVRIDINCTTQNRVASIQYIVAASHPDDTGAAFALLAGELQPLFGEPAMSSTADSRTLSFGCIDPSPVRLEEWIVTDHDEGDSVGEAEHEVYLAIVPDLMSCLDMPRA